ncbi:unnamed protein product, partial [Mesorhabditis belari]|uniref:Carboxylic ester hydrolase n=1 Tax=Mesorhabditis belari TaxID=2138241 RepID=A0AAF3FL32_9BILA
MKDQLFIVFTCFFVCNYTQNVTIKTPMGTVTGFRVDLGNDKLIYGKADIFLGIPFAEPPLGNLRFQKPQPLISYPNGHVDATQYKPACTQPLDPFWCRIQSEDCLYLNVFTPNATTTDRYPVMVWIHGGGLQAGCGNQWTYLGATRNLVSRGVVVVVIQYRLGVPGFFTTNTADFPPNRGLLDQLETLKWVQRNIAFFGGDANLVTIFGQSSGGSSVNAHLYSPLSKGLFHRAIMESGALYLHTDSQAAYSTASENVAEKAYVSEAFDSPGEAEIVKRLNGYRPVPHSAEVFYLWFGWADSRFDIIYDKGKTTKFDLQLADTLGTWWTNFAKFGQPTQDNLWKTMTLKPESEFLRIDSPENGGMTMVSGYLDRDFRVFQQQLRHYDEPTDSKGKTTPFFYFTYFTIFCRIYLEN